MPGFETGLMDEMIAEILDPATNPNGSTGMYGGEGVYDAYGYYRYGFNGQEKSDEIKGSGNSYTAEFWEYDPRLGRRWNVDPIYKHSPYEAFGGNPIIYADPMGLDTISFNKHTTIVTPSNSGFSGGGMKATVKSTFSINVKEVPGEDVFMSVNTSTQINGDGSVSYGRPQTKILDPYSNQASGITKGQNLYFDGILTTVRDNKDWESVGKFMNLDRGFYDYMINRHPASAGWRSRALSIEAMEGVMPVLVYSGLGSYAGLRYSGNSRLLGVSDGALDRVVSRLSNLRKGNNYLIDKVDAFGSRAGSTFRGRGPLITSDLDVMIRLKSVKYIDDPWVIKTLQNISDDFFNSTGIPLNFKSDVIKKSLGDIKTISLFSR
jgi:hypothetical protein